MKKKRCRQCKRVKPATTEFWHKQPLLKGGLRNQCKVCVTTRRRNWRHANPDKAREISRRERSTPQFRARSREYQKRRRLENPEAFRARRRAYYAKKLKSKRVLLTREERRRRAHAAQRRHWLDHRQEKNAQTRNYLARKKKAKGSHTWDDVMRILELQQFRCIWCEDDISGNQHSVDHLVPLSRGGSNGPENIAAACKSCNSAKHNRLPIEFIWWSFKKGRVIMPSILGMVEEIHNPKR